MFIVRNYFLSSSWRDWEIFQYVRKWEEVTRRLSKRVMETSLNAALMYGTDRTPILESSLLYHFSR